MTLKELFNEATEHIPNPLTVLGTSLGFAWKRATGSKADAIVQKLSSGKQDDNIIVPKDAKTLLGEDVSVLYEEYTVESREGDDGTSQEYITGDNKAYQTELYTITRPHTTSYDICTNHEKAVYEITLLSKKAAYEYQHTGDNKYIDEYSARMAMYQQFCTSNNMDWKQVLQDVSYELQDESYNYKQKSEKVIQTVNWDEDRVYANQAHLFLKSVMPSDMTDKFDPRLPSDFTYDDTLDTQDNSKTGAERVGSSFGNAIVKLGDAIKNSGIGKAVAGVFSFAAGSVKKFVDAFSAATGDDKDNKADDKNYNIKQDDSILSQSTIDDVSDIEDDSQFDTVGL